LNIWQVWEELLRPALLGYGFGEATIKKFENNEDRED